MIGLCAQARMGKDTIADYIVEHNHNWVKHSFAKQLKLLISTFYNISLEEIEEFKTSDNVHQNVNMKMRYILQLVGETFRTISKDVWVNMAMQNIPMNTNVIFTDVRYENEMNAITRQHGHLILIGRTKYLINDPHPSEIFLQEAIVWFLENTTACIVETQSLENIPEKFSQYSFFIRNDSSLNELYANLASTLPKILKQND
jgi:hypothetical protein